MFSAAYYHEAAPSLEVLNNEHYFIDFPSLPTANNRSYSLIHSERHVK